ncbi:glycosyltransferase [Paenibacillus xylaniclasticus]|uniref:glycosyltransferase n=1 Tax=Paenibacillus xylaniclasticus TaxID=588083 RepID=UPI0013DF3297|nr:MULTISPECIES: glycosyltransferase [Paenibacillus]GFN29857.1 hypothetical protein PCURB6_01170 [Paenibacillus curdlanolyticus]
MKKNIYICFLREESEIVGILNKVRQQCLAIHNLGVQSSLIISRNHCVVQYDVIDNKLVEIRTAAYTKLGQYNEDNSKFAKKVSSLLRLKQFFKFAKQVIEEKQPDSIYIRNISPITMDVARFLKYCSRQRRKVYWEIPTYSEIQDRIRNLRTLYYRIMHHYISRYLTNNVAIAAEEGLERKGFIFTTNGVNARSIKLKEHKQHPGINLICVATFDYWHGYDRLLEGLKNYYAADARDRNQQVHIHMVGNGNVKPLEDLTAQYGLGCYVTFHGVLLGQELDQLFDEMDIAIGNLGFHRRGVFADTSIKIREYCARGVPFVTALNDSDFPQPFQFRKKVPADESAIDIGSIIEFYEHITSRHPNFSQEMRRYAENHLTWEQKMRFIRDGADHRVDFPLQAGRRAANEG